MSAYTFQAQFEGKLTCTVTFDPAVHYNPEAHYCCPAKQWSPEPTKEEYAAFFPQYVEWSHTVYAEIAKIINHEHGTIFQERRSQHPHWECWIYYPDGTRECRAKGEGFVPKGFNPYA